MIPFDPNIPRVDSPNFLIRLYDLFKQIIKEVNSLITYSVQKDSDGKVSIEYSNTTDPINGLGDALSVLNTDTTAGSITSIVFRGYDAGGTSRHSGVIRWIKAGAWSSGSGSYPAKLSVMTRPNGSGDEFERLAVDENGNTIINVNGTAPTLATNSQMTFELTSNTTLKIKVRGTDGTTRSVSLTLA